jgi:hypothetical protein
MIGVIENTGTCEQTIVGLPACWPQVGLQPVHLPLIEAGEITLAVLERLDRVEHHEVPAGLVEAVERVGQAEPVARVALAPAGLVAGGLALGLVPAPDVVVAEQRAVRDRALVAEDLFPQLPLELGAGRVLAVRVHDVVAGEDDEVGPVGAGLHVAEAGGEPLDRAPLRLEVHVGQVGDAERRPARPAPPPPSSPRARRAG